LDQGLAKTGHDVGWVVHSQTTDNANRKFPDGEDLVIQGNKQRAHIFGLREVVVKALVERREHSLPDRGL